MKLILVLIFMKWLKFVLFAYVLELHLFSCNLDSSINLLWLADSIKEWCWIDAESPEVVWTYHQQILWVQLKILGCWIEKYRGEIRPGIQSSKIQTFAVKNLPLTSHQLSNLSFVMFILGSMSHPCEEQSSLCHFMLHSTFYLLTHWPLGSLNKLFYKHFSS